MRVLRKIRENPVFVLFIALSALITWVAIDLIKPPAPREAVMAPGQNEADVTQQRYSAMTDEGPTQGVVPGNPAVSVSLLPRLRPGMTRVEVEGLLGPPTADRVQPVTLADGRLRYRTTYELDDLGAPMTVRPIRPRRPLPLPPSTEPRSQIALEFDASQPGHPLVEILYPDPLF